MVLKILTNENSNGNGGNKKIFTKENIEYFIRWKFWKRVKNGYFDIFLF